MSWLEERFGPIPMAISSWARLVGDVWSVGTHPSWAESSGSDPLVIEIEGTRYPGASMRDFFDSELEAWQEWATDDDAGGVLPLAPDGCTRPTSVVVTPTEFGFRMPRPEGVFVTEVAMPFVLPELGVSQWWLSRASTGDGQWRVKQSLSNGLLGPSTPRTSSRVGRMARIDERRPDELRPVTITRNWLDHAEGSVLVEYGKTRVLCAASVTQGVPRWRRGSGLGWVTAEYAMLPRATNTRSDRESVKGRIGGRTHEISRLVGRSLRSVIDYKALGENTIVLDCDVLQADGGTRTAAITGAYVALADAVTWLRERGFAGGRAAHRLGGSRVVGIVAGEPMLDLCYEEDVVADTDMNVVMTGEGAYVEVQGTAEAAPFDRKLLDAMLDLAATGCAELTESQRRALET